MVALGWLIVNPFIEINDPYVFVMYLFILLLASVVFLWPQLGIHRLQIDEQERLLEEANQRYEAMIGELHQRVDTGDMEDAMSMSMTISSLQAELKAIENIPAWPWNPETLRLLISALALPMGLWLLQMILQRVLAP